MLRNKGESLICFPNEYVVVDIETTGLSPEYDEIIEISAIKIKDNSIIDRFTSFVKPKYEISEFIEKLTGITNKMLKTAPSLKCVIPKFKDFISNSILLGYNVNFDINFLYDALVKESGIELSNNYIDVLRIARIVLKDTNLPNYKLKNIALHFNLDINNMHRGEKDCELTFEVFKNIQHKIIEKFSSFDNFIEERKRYKYLSTKDITTENREFDISHPCYEREFAFTGTLDKMPRKEAMQIVVDFGGKVSNNVTKKTNYLVMGNLDYSRTVDGEKSLKIIKAEELKLKGFDIYIIPENVFYDMFSDDVLNNVPAVKSKNDKRKHDILLYCNNTTLKHLPYNLDLIKTDLSLQEKIEIFEECCQEGLIKYEDKKVTYERELTKLKVSELQEILKKLNLENSEKTKKTLINRILDNINIDDYVNEQVFCLTTSGQEFLNK